MKIFFSVFTIFFCFASISKTLNPSEFVEFCGSSRLTEAQKVARDGLFKVVRVDSCQGFFDKVTKDSEIISNYCSSKENHISDLSLLLYFPDLKKLSLGCHKISDLAVLAELTNLESLGLETNLITDVKPLAGLKKLKYLGLGRNQISSLKPLRDLVSLKDFYFDGDTVDMCLDNDTKIPFCKMMNDVYKDRRFDSAFELIAMNSKWLVFREYYDIHECCGGREAVDCEYPGLKKMADSFGAPNGGLAIHFVPFEKKKILALEKALSKARTFYIYKGSFEKGRCQKAEDSTLQLQDAKKFARSKGIDLDSSKVERVVLKTKNLNLFGCFKNNKNKDCVLSETFENRKISVDTNILRKDNSEEYEYGEKFWYELNVSIGSKKYKSTSSKYEGSMSFDRKPLEIYRGKDQSLLVVNIKGAAMGNSKSSLYIFPLE